MALAFRAMRELPGLVWAFAGAKVALHMVTTRLGYHRDEFYFISASKRLAASYVDFQPAIPVLVRLVRSVSGDWIFGMRLIPALAGTAVIVLAALIGRELGGDRQAQILAAFAALVIPLFVGANSALNTVSLEVPAWLFVVLLLARTERTDDPRRWIWVGVAIGAALLVKFTVLAYLVGVPIAIVATRMRRHLSTPWPWLGGLITLLIVAPSLVWQVTHELPIVEFVSSQSSGGKVLGLSGRLGFLTSLLLFPGPAGLFLIVPGIRALLRDDAWRAAGILTVVPLIVFLAVSGKGYYATPALAVVFTAGAVAVVHRRDRIPRWLDIALVVNLLIPLPLLVPLIPVSVLSESSDLADATEMGERMGWRELASTADDVVDALPADDRGRAVIIGSNYTIPSVIEFYRPEMDLPPAVSGHNSAYLWWPDHPSDHVAVMIGFDTAEIDPLYEDVERVATIRNHAGVDNYEWGKPVYVCRGPKVSWDELRERLRRFTA